MFFRGNFVDCPNLGQVEIYHDYLLSVNDTGFIDHFSPADSQESGQILRHSPPYTEIPDGSFMLPTFCDLHLHAPQFLYQGTGLHLPLMEWLNQYAFEAEEKLDSDPMLTRRVYKRLANRLIENGTGIVLLFGTIKEATNLILAEVMQAAGIRAFVGKLSMDISSRPSYVEASAQDSIMSAASFAEKCSSLVAHLPPHKRLVEPVVTPRFVPTCSNDLLAGLGRLSEEKGLRIQSHMAEAHDQIQWVERERGMSDIEVFDSNNLLTPRTVQAHCTFLNVESLSHVFHRGIAIAHCPLSNAYFSAEPFRLREALHQRVRVGLGTDIAGGYSLDIMNAMRQAVVVSRMREGSRKLSGGHASADNVDEWNESQSLAIDWKEALYLATKGGRQALGFPNNWGTFTPGAPFDAQCIQLYENTTRSGIGALDFLDTESAAGGEGSLPEMVEKWFCIGDHRNRQGMWVQGTKLSTHPS